MPTITIRNDSLTIKNDCAAANILLLYDRRRQILTVLKKKFCIKNFTGRREKYFNQKKICGELKILCKNLFACRSSIDTGQNGQLVIFPWNGSPLRKAAGFIFFR
jgi:hypothetical protein